jgi:hypothetical protein
MISRIRFFRRKTDSEYHKSCAILIFLCQNDNRATLTLEQPLPRLLSTTLIVIVPLVVVLQCEGSGMREAACVGCCVGCLLGMGNLSCHVSFQHNFFIGVETNSRRHSVLAWLGLMDLLRTSRTTFSKLGMHVGLNSMMYWQFLQSAARYTVSTVVK